MRFLDVLFSLERLCKESKTKKIICNLKFNAYIDKRKRGIFIQKILFVQALFIPILVICKFLEI
jgi:hypothetical protein